MTWVIDVTLNSGARKSYVADNPSEKEARAGAERMFPDALSITITPAWLARLTRLAAFLATVPNDRLDPSANHHRLDDGPIYQNGVWFNRPGDHGTASTPLGHATRVFEELCLVPGPVLGAGRCYGAWVKYGNRYDIAAAADFFEISWMDALALFKDRPADGRYLAATITAYCRGASAEDIRAMDRVQRGGGPCV